MAAYEFATAVSTVHDAAAVISMLTKGLTHSS
jgi:hypothetical protein